MPELEEVLERLGLLHYLGRLQDEGFNRWETVLDITEIDLAALNFKLGHRRILQREIASARGVASTQALTSTQFGPVDDIVDQDDRLSQRSLRMDPGKGPQPTGKRKYRRHPKADENAPEKPPSAYVMFANRVRDELKGQSLSFTDIAKLVGERWKVLAPEDKECYEHQASIAKDKYNAEFEEYKKTESYREYVKYLADFKSKANKEGKDAAGSEDQSDLTQKRPRLDSIPSAGGSTSSTTPSTLSGGPASSTRAPGSASAHTSSPHQLGLSPPVNYSTAQSSHLVSSPLSPSPSTGTVVKDFANQDPAGRHEQSPQEPDSHFFPRIHPTVQSPHIQQQSSYLRHKSAASPAPHASTRSVMTLPAPGMRRAQEIFSPLSSVSGSISSSGSSSAPSVASLTPSVSGLDDTSRSQRALPLPTPTSSGYFDQRLNYQHRPPSQPQSPRIFPQPSSSTSTEHPSRYSSSGPPLSPSPNSQTSRRDPPPLPPHPPPHPPK